MGTTTIIGLLVLAALAGPGSQIRSQISQLPERPKPSVRYEDHGMVLPRGMDKKWFALALGGQSAAMLDVNTTVSDAQCRIEDDPLARWAVCLPTPAYVAVAVAMTSAVSFVGLEMRRSKNAWIRRLWWVPQVAQISINTRCAITNIRNTKCMP
jgi:hypothetical protein